MLRKILGNSKYVELEFYSDFIEIDLSRRFRAFSIDMFVVACLWLLCSLLGQWIVEQGYSTSTANYLIPLCYFLFRDCLPNGQSIGKKIANIQVVDIEDGRGCDLWQSFLRNALGAPLFLFDLIYSHKKLGAKLGDICAWTVVVARV